MGIKGLTTFLSKKYPHLLKKRTISQLQGQTFALDVSNWLYQFLIKTKSSRGGFLKSPTDSRGNQTGHLLGLMSRVQFCLKNNLHVVWVFDGKPPEEKFQTLKLRKQGKQKAQKQYQQALEQQKFADLLKISQRTVTLTQAQKQDAKKLLELIGLPVFQAPSQAEPQCAQIVKQNLAYATISQDMDTLTFGCPRLIRGFTKLSKKSQEQDNTNLLQSNQEQKEQSTDSIRKNDCFQISLAETLEALQFTYPQFVDLCILFGCDYTSKISQVGPQRGYQLMKKCKDIDKILQFIASDPKYYRYKCPDSFNHYMARSLFKKPKIAELSHIKNKNILQRSKSSQKQLCYNKFDQTGLREFLFQRDFSQVRVNNWMKRVKETGLWNQVLV